MLKLNEFKNALIAESKEKSALISKEELSLIQGGKKRYFIGDDEVSEGTYKTHVECVTGSASQY